MSYLVMYRIDSEAETPRAAAIAAWKTLVNQVTDPEAFPPVLEVDLGHAIVKYEVTKRGARELRKPEPRLSDQEAMERIMNELTKVGSSMGREDYAFFVAELVEKLETVAAAASRAIEERGP